MTEQPPPLPDDWEYLDLWESWWLAHDVFAERGRAGEPLPDMFIPRDRGER